MSKYNKHARALDEMARRNFAAYLKAKETFEKAEKIYQENKRQNVNVWVADASMIARANRAEADYVEAKEAFKNAKKAYASSLDEVKNIRRELEKDIQENTRARADDMDTNAMELLKSGVLRPSEYKALLSDFRNNPTMIRMIGSYAKQRADEAEKHGDPDMRSALFAVYEESRGVDGSEHLRAFGYLEDVYRRCVNNTAMIGYWDQLTANTVENF